MHSSERQTDAPLTRGLPPALKLYAICLVSLAVLSWLDAVIGLLRGEGRAALLYLWPPDPGFDFICYLGRFAHLHTARFFSEPGLPWYYPAPAIFVLAPFYAITLRTGHVFGFALFVGTIVCLLLLALRRLQAALVAHGLSRNAARLLLWSTLLLGWPVYFALQRGNIEGLSWFTTAVAMSCFVRRRYLPAALLLGVVGSFKLYPLLFLALLLPLRRFKEIAAGLLLAGLLTLVGLYTLGPQVVWTAEQVQSGVRAWTVVVTGRYDAMMIGCDHSLFALLRLCLHTRPSFQVERVLPVYLGFAAVMMTALFFGRIWRLPRPNQVLFLTCATVLLPPASFDYTLVSLLIPWAWLAVLALHAPNRDQPGYGLLMVLFAVVLGPIGFLHGRGVVFANYQGAARTIALLGLLTVACLRPFPELPEEPFAPR